MIERLLYHNLELWMTKGFFYLDLNGRYQMGFSSLNPRAIERLIYPILNWDDQGASLPQFE